MRASSRCRTRCPPVLALLAGLAIGAAGCATTGAPLPEMATDRPDFTESASTRPPRSRPDRGRLHLHPRRGRWRPHRPHIPRGPRTHRRRRPAGAAAGPESRHHGIAGARRGRARAVNRRRGRVPRRRGAPGGPAGRPAGDGAHRQATLPTGAASLSAGRALPGLNWILRVDLLPISPPSPPARKGTWPWTRRGKTTWS